MEGQKKEEPKCVIDNVKRALDTTEKLNDKNKLNNEEYKDLCEDLKKIYEHINYVKIKKVTMTTTIYYKTTNRTCCDNDEGIITNNTMRGNVFSHNPSNYEPDDDEEQCCNPGDIRVMNVSNGINIEYKVLRVEESDPHRRSVGETYIETQVMECMKNEGMWIGNDAIYSYVCDM